jgi:protein arginine kinase activator
MLCDFCHEKVAVFNVQNTQHDKTITIHLCEACAEKHGLKLESDDSTIQMSNIFNNTSLNQCPKCGRKLKEIKREGRLGCRNCYSAFKNEIEKHLTMMGATGPHKGKLPEHLKVLKQLLSDREDMKKSLDDAVSQEKYEEAAKIRDRLVKIDNYFVTGRKSRENQPS